MFQKKFKALAITTFASFTLVSTPTTAALAPITAVSIDQLAPILNLIKYTSTYDSLTPLEDKLDILGKFLRTKLYNNTYEGAEAFVTKYGIQIDGYNFKFSFSDFKAFYKELFGLDPSLKINTTFNGATLIMSDTSTNMEPETTLQITDSEIILHSKAAYANLIYTTEYAAEITNYLGDNLYKIKIYQYSTANEEKQLQTTYDALVKQDLLTYVPLLLTETEISDTALDLTPYFAPSTSTNDEIIEEILQLVNEERIKAGIHPLELDYELTKVAQIKSTDMQENQYFSHESPTYGSPITMMESFDISGWNKIGENIAMGHKNPATVMKSWMSSSDHKANILKEEYTHIGIGYADEENYWTQIFIGMHNDI
ncbi:CAP domain-containing protein [Candidatus Epulonipiscium viviparus]|uniref:CAP domain-containing protein n=1 Tax=Candidatus Epulonipiscium viviparus TaxID=420336 RepID=UPI00016C0D77|nr:CAP domain-containing protein [Candidatus Epulopiscium viviparus]